MKKLQTTIIEGSNGAIEISLTEPCVFTGRQCKSSNRAHKNWVVICHPHPQFGGTMSNKVVTTLAKAFHQLGYGTLSFNFRGVGRSSGQYDAGEGETKDLVWLTNWLMQHFEVDQCVIAGFSFGAYVALKASEAIKPNKLCLVAPPVNLYDFSPYNIDEIPMVVFQGGQDEVVPPEEVKDWLAQVQLKDKGLTDFYWRGSASHFFHKQLGWLKSCVFAAF